jgi:hypothetical protein
MQCVFSLSLRITFRDVRAIPRPVPPKNTGHHAEVNEPHGIASSISGGYDNRAAGTASLDAGGYANRATAKYSAILAGTDRRAG